jgi:hypothetical protein
MHANSNLNLLLKLIRLVDLCWVEMEEQALASDQLAQNRNRIFALMREMVAITANLQQGLPSQPG